jgi:DNA-binding transcriptional ArsR family regulator
MTASPDALILRRLARSEASSSELADLLGVTRQAVHRRLRRLAETGAVVARGAGRSATWASANAAELTLRRKTRGLQEDLVYADLERQSSTLRALGGDGRSIAFYAFTEMLNNVIDHSQSVDVRIDVKASAAGLEIAIADRGIGAFASIQRHEKLATPLEALQELTKGKVTTMPERHTGEGIFFTSKAVETFVLEANGIEWLVDNRRDDNAVRAVKSAPGTRVSLAIARRPARPLEALFREYTDDFDFVKTRTVVRLFAIGVSFVSRSEARRLVHGLEKFREVVLDFDRVESVGQAFADEVFRVFARSFPGTTLVPVDMCEAVAFMVGRARSAR